MIMSECVVSNTTQSVTQYTINDETYKSTYHWRISLPFKFWLSASDNHSDGPFVALTPAASQTTHCHGYLLLIVTLRKRLCDCYMSRGLYRSMQTKTQCRRRRTRGNGLGRQRAICMNGVARNRNILALDEYISWWWLATEHGLSSFESTILPRILISQTSGSRKILPC